MIPRVIYSVSDVNRYIKTLIGNDENLKFIFVKGEISNFKYASNGHLYFTLKDKDCMISVMMFENYARKLTFTPKNGDEITVLASVDVYPARGTYSLIAYELEQKGQGAILVELEKLKKQLMVEGLFDESRKRKINIYPKKIGVITAPNSAAIKDIVTNLHRRYPICEIYFFPSAVQGENAPKELLLAFNKSQEYDLDTLIIGRGGGASEDLSAFNDEAFVRAIANSKMPVIAAVGHEIDSTLVDYVSDKRASTPTGAAELATIDIREIRQTLSYALIDMKEGITTKLSDIKEEFIDLKEKLARSLKDKLLIQTNETKFIKEKLNSAIKEKFLIRENAIKVLKEKLEALNPNKVLTRGYSLSMDENGNVLDSVNKVKLGDIVVTMLKDGKLTSIVNKKE